MIEHIEFDPNRPSDRIPLVAENPAAIVSKVLAVLLTRESVTFEAICDYVESALSGDNSGRGVYSSDIEAVLSYLEAIEFVESLYLKFGSTSYKLIRPIALSEGATNFLES